jgi:hypothetical protein
MKDKRKMTLQRREVFRVKEERKKKEKIRNQTKEKYRKR